MGTVAVRVVCVGGGRSMPSFYLFLHVWVFFFLSRYRPVFTLSASFNALPVGNGIRPFSFSMTAFCSDTGLFTPCRRHVLSICREWHLSFRLCYHVQCLTHTSLTPVFGGQSITNAPRITQSTQVPHVPLKNLSRQAA